MDELLIEATQNLLSRTDEVRRAARGMLSTETKSSYAQFMTPAPVAAFMASLFPPPIGDRIAILDPGAGVGSLTSALVERLNRVSRRLEITVEAHEVDPVMATHLEGNLKACELAAAERSHSLRWRVVGGDFIHNATDRVSAAEGLWAAPTLRFSHCIMNPPYKKISNDSSHRRALSGIGIETVNLYSAFLALALLLMADGGHLVAIIPRSFCNGPYYRPFRKQMLRLAAVRRIHLFGSRDQAFREDKVLQENIILHLERGAVQGGVTISTSRDDTFADIALAVHPFEEVVRASDAERVIHIPTADGQVPSATQVGFSATLTEIGAQVSTGPVVDFRLRGHLLADPAPGAVPLLYPCHFRGGAVRWPILGGKKPNALALNDETRKWLFPPGHYVVVRRFSSKEERRRVVAAVVDPDHFMGADWLGFENHLNVFHIDRGPLPRALAQGLAAYLNSSSVDRAFRKFSGHTQVNASDLKRMAYPSRESLIRLGEWVEAVGAPSEEEIEGEIERMRQ